MKQLYYSQDIESDQYQSFIQFMANMFPVCSLAYQNHIKLKERGLSVLEKLHPFLISEEDVDKYPGGFGYSPGAIKLLKYRTIAGCVFVLRETCSRLFEWEVSLLPEDLAFYRDDGTNAFGSVSHEGYCFFVFTPSELRKLEEKFPDVYSNLETE